MRNRTRLAATRFRSLRLESLEDRWLLSASPTWMNDNWHFLNDQDGSGSLSVGDLIGNNNDAIAPDTITAEYGVDGFGVVTTGDHPGSLPDYDQLQDAIDNTTTGGTLHVLPGFYTPPSTLEITQPLNLLGPQAGVDPRTSQGSARTAGDTTTEAVIDGGGLANLLQIRAHDVVVDGLEFTNASDDMIESLVADAIERPVLQYNFVHNATGDEGIQLRAATDPLIQFNQVYNTAGDAINLAGATGGVIRDNEVFDNFSPDAAIYVYGSVNTEISNNLVYNVFVNDGIKLGSKLGTDAGLTGGVIADNVIHDVVQDGITVYTSDVQVRANRVYRSTSENGAIFVQFAVDNVIITDNDVVDNFTSGVRIGRGTNSPVFVGVLDNRITGNDTGIRVDGSTALIEGNDLTGNFVGLLIQNGALVDAGSIDDPDDGNSNPTGRSVGSDVDGSSWGANILTGYTGAGGNFAIENQNRIALGHPDVKAENNMFGTVDLAEVEAVVFHSPDDPALTVVDYVPAAPLVRIIDDGEPGYNDSGTWGTGVLGYNGDNRYSAAGTGSDVATWTFSALSDGLYRVSATWVATSNRATNSPFTVFDGASAFKTVRVNQELPPDDLTDAGAAWEDLGGLYPITSGVLQVRLTDAANEFVIADAIRIERVGALPDAPGPATIIDDGEPGYSDSGTWGTGVLGYNGDNRYSAAGTGSDVATWTFSGVSEGIYRVSATWVATSNRATNSPFAVFDGPSTFKTMPINQRVAPDDFIADGASWEVLGGVYPISSGTLHVRLTDAANHFVIADAIRIERVGDVPGVAPSPPTIIDNGDPGYTDTGNWMTGPLGFQGDNRYSASGSGNDRALWTFENVTDGLYRVSATWAPKPNRATNSPFTVFDSGSPFKTLNVNQELAPDDFPDSGAMWEDLGGLYPISTGLLAVQLTDAANEFVIADAIRAVRVGDLPGAPGPATIVDNSDPGYSDIGDWATGPAGSIGDNRYSAPGDGSDVAEWVVSGLTSGLYRVSATWVASSNRASDSPFSIRDGASAFKSIRVDQKSAPNDFSADGVTWEVLGGLYPISSGTLTVQLTDDANGFVIADAIRVERMADIPVGLTAPPPAPSLAGAFANSSVREELAMGDPSLRPSAGAADGVFASDGSDLAVYTQQDIVDAFASDPWQQSKEDESADAEDLLVEGLLDDLLPM